MTVTSEHMERTCTDVREGYRLAITVEFITRRVIDCGDERIHRLLVADRTGTQFVVLTTPDQQRPAGLQSGELYQLAGLLGADPVEATDDSGAACPACDGSLRPGRVLDTVDSAVGEAASQLDLSEPFGILDGTATIREIPARDSPVDDWIPVADSTPDCVCVSCGQHVERVRSRDSRTADRRSGESASDRRAGLSTTGRRRAESPDMLALRDSGVDPSAPCVYRAAVANGYTPRPAALGDEHLFDGHRFELEGKGRANGLFTPQYGVAESESPLAGRSERYLAVALDSTVPGEAFERPPLDLVVVLDHTGSMAGPLDPQDPGFGERRSDDATTKLDAAKRGLCALTGQLREDDRLGIVLPTATGAAGEPAHVAKPLRDVGETDLPAIRDHVREVDPVAETDSNTGFAGGFETAVDVLDATDARGDGRERRVLCLSDLRSSGAKDADCLTDRLADAATDGIHTTLLGVGFDANARLAKRLTTVRGGNYHLVHSAAAFEHLFEKRFDRLVTPVAYDLTLELDGANLRVESVHGSPSGERVTDRLVHVGTAFSRAGDGPLRAGFVLVRVSGTATAADLTVSWTESGGGEYTESVTLGLVADTDDDLRAAVTLARCGRELRAWAAERHDPTADGERPHSRVTTDGGRRDPTTGDRRHDSGTGDDRRQDSATDNRGGAVPHSCDGTGRGPVPLAISDRRARRFDRLYAALTERDHVAGDLRRELSLLDVLCRQAPLGTPA